MVWTQHNEQEELSFQLHIHLVVERVYQQKKYSKPRYFVFIILSFLTTHDYFELHLRSLQYFVQNFLVLTMILFFMFVHE